MPFFSGSGSNCWLSRIIQKFRYLMRASEYTLRCLFSLGECSRCTHSPCIHVCVCTCVCVCVCDFFGFGNRLTYLGPFCEGLEFFGLTGMHNTKTITVFWSGFIGATTIRHYYIGFIEGFFEVEGFFLRFLWVLCGVKGVIWCGKTRVCAGFVRPVGNHGIDSLNLSVRSSAICEWTRCFCKHVYAGLTMKWKLKLRVSTFNIIIIFYIHSWSIFKSSFYHAEYIDYIYFCYII